MVLSNPSTRGRRESRPTGSISAASIVESIVGCKWSVRLLGLCAEGHRRPSALLRACPGLSAKVMNERLRKMTRFGIVQRTVFGEKPPVAVEYKLTPIGLRFMRILDDVRRLQKEMDQRLVDVPREGQGATDGSRSARPTNPPVAVGTRSLSGKHYAL
jgi:DNA-binding HxlR family transcriptional regulator